MDAPTHRSCIGIAFVIMVVIIAGCSALRTITDMKTSLRDRVTDYMDARMQGDKAKSHAFFSRESKERIPREKYLSIPQTISYVSYAIDTIDIADTEKEAEVTVKIDIKIMTFVFKGITQTQQWLWENGSWCIDVKPVTGLPGSSTKKK